jgi:exodeoxyribonuclease VII large subunit
VDLILVTRGGGSLEDLAGFNDERLARTIVASALPVVAAIGHEIDHTIAEYVADLRAPTPSAAAELITAAQHRIEERLAALERRVLRAGELHLLRARQRLERLSVPYVLARLRDSIGLREQGIDDLRQRLALATDRRLRTRTTRLAALEARLRRHDPTLRLSLAQSRLAAATKRIERLSTTLISRPRTRLEAATRRLDRLPETVVATRRRALDRAVLRLQALSPLAVLNRGYAIVYVEGGEQETILRDAAEALPNQQIRARLARGSVRARITETDPA